MSCSCVSTEILQKMWERPFWEGVWPYFDPWDSVRLCTASVEWNVPGKFGPHGELFFFLIKKEPATIPDSETFSSFITALKKFALIAMHSVAEGGESGCQTPDLGDTRRFGCSNCPMWEIEGEAWYEDEAFVQVFLERTMCATVRCTSSGCMGRIETEPDRSGRLSHAKYLRAPSIDLMAFFQLRLHLPIAPLSVSREAQSADP